MFDFPLESQSGIFGRVDPCAQHIDLSQARVERHIAFDEQFAKMPVFGFEIHRSAYRARPNATTVLTKV